MPHECHVAHRLPGRIRLRAPAAKGDPDFFHRVHDLITAVDGVRQVEANPVTGSVVVHYDKNERAIEQRLQKAFEDENTLLSMVVPNMQEAQKIAGFVQSDVALLAGRSRAAAAIANAVKALNLALKRSTNNTVDLQLLTPFALAGAGLVFVDRKRDPLLWIMLLYVAFHTFLTLHQPIAMIPARPASPVPPSPLPQSRLPHLPH